MVSADQLYAEIDDRWARGQELRDRPVNDEADLRERRQNYYTWTEYNEELLRRSFDVGEPADDYARNPGIWSIGGAPEPLLVRVQEFRDDISGKMRRLRSLQERLPLFQLHPDAAVLNSSPVDSAVLGEDVFIVHGHDGETKVTVARFLLRLLGREPIILHEQPDRGRTIIEKFEDHAAQAACAIVLLTGDDVGGPADGPQQLRGRQNVVLELGFFLGKLGRSRVVILYESRVELPSDLHGVLYIELDNQGAWCTRVARELGAVGLKLNLEALLN
jgi:hypothetical protein